MQLKNQPFYAPLVAALAVTEALNSFLTAKEGFKIKWINDVHYENKKVSGTLCVCQPSDNAIYLSVGIGVNLN